MTVHIIGSGLSGLSAAFALTQANIPVVLYDAASRTGGRCHSFSDKHLQALLDNGTHLMLGANTALLNMLRQCPTETPLKNMGNQILFLKKDGSFFQINTAHPFSVLRKLPCLYPLLCESVLNTPVRQADTALFLKTAIKCFGKENGQVYLADPSLYDCVVAPVEHFLKNKSVPFYFGKRLKRIREHSLTFFDGSNITLKEHDKVILAVDPENLSRLIIGAAEIPYQPIINIHYKTTLRLPENKTFAGLIGLTGHWIFIRNGIISVTISAAETLLRNLQKDSVASVVWQELSSLFKVSPEIPDYRIVIEKRATILQSRQNNRLRLNTDIGSENIFLAGDTISIDLPCTIEGSVRSGIKAAEAVLKSMNER